MEEGRSAFKILTGKSRGKRYLGRPRRKWDAIVRIDVKETDVSTRNWTDRGYWGSIVNTV